MFVKNRSFGVVSTVILSFCVPSAAYATSLCFDASGATAACSDAVTVQTVDGYEFRTYDGRGNNRDYKDWGAANTLFQSRGQAGDGSPTHLSGPETREVSNRISKETTPVLNEDKLSSMFWAWGQFIDHDITLTKESHDEKMALNTDRTDSVFGSSEMLINRSENQRDANGILRQENQITAFLDGSMVYGSDAETAHDLRTNDGTGRLQLGPGGLLPTDGEGNFKAGDVRVNEQQQLITMHTVFAREHNRLADELSEDNPAWSGERIYQEARELVGAQIQAVTYNEWLPRLLGEQAPSSYTGYNPSVDPSLTTEFSTCAFRFCHSMIPEELERLQENGNPIADGHLALRDGFFNPNEFRDAGGVDPLIRGLAQQQAREVDTQFSDDIRDFLNLDEEENSDLFARNLLRGRDHGLADYNALREAYGLPPITSWAELTDDPVLQAELAALYGETPDGLDPYLGGLLEPHVEGGIVGSLNAAIISDQFNRLRDGDRFWYENRFTGDRLAWIENRTLSDIMRDNSNISWLQEDIFTATQRKAVAPAGFGLMFGIGGWFWIRRQIQKL